MIGPTPLVDCFRRGDADRDTRMLAARGALATRGIEQLLILALLAEDEDPEIRQTAVETVARIRRESIEPLLSRPDVPVGVRGFFANHGVVAGEAVPSDDDTVGDEPLAYQDQPVDDPGDEEISGTGAHIADPGDEPPTGRGPAENRETVMRETAVQKLAKMTFGARLKAAVQGSREMRALLIRDPNRMIAAAVLSSPKLTEPEVESYARMATLSDEVLRIIAGNRAWTKNYNIVLALTKNPKTPLAISLTFMSRLNSRDLAQLSVDRNVPEPLRIAARKRVVSNR